MMPATPSPASLAAIARWPDVPACYGWLSLDRRGGWRLQGEPITHGGLIAFLNASYGADAEGNWLIHNGPQRVYVALDYLPLVVRLQPDGGLRAHTGLACSASGCAFLDDEGNALIETENGPALVDDRDLAAFLAEVRDARGAAADEASLAATMQGAHEPTLFWRELPLLPIARARVAQHFGFQPQPQPSGAALPSR